MGQAMRRIGSGTHTACFTLLAWEKTCQRGITPFARSNFKVISIEFLVSLLGTTSKWHAQKQVWLDLNIKPLQLN